MGAEAKKQDVVVAEEKLADKFFLVIIGDDASDSPQLIESETMDAFAKTVDEHVLNAKATLHAFGFVGKRIQISSPAPVCTVEVNGQKADVGRDNKNFEVSGRFTPLRRDVPE